MCRQKWYLLLLVAVLELAGTGPAKAADPNLVGWWRLDEGSGATAHDSSGNGNDGILMNNPQWTAGKFGSALDFGGTGSYVDCGNGPSLNVVGQITLAMWFKPKDAASGKDITYFSKGDNSYVLKHSGNNTVTLWIAGASLAVRFAVDQSFNNVWHHVAATYDRHEERFISTASSKLRSTVLVRSTLRP